MISRKAELPIPYILAIILLVIVLAIVAWWLYTGGVGFDVVSSDAVCKAKLGFYCNQYALDNYQAKPSGQDFSAACGSITKENKGTFYAPDCCSYDYALAVSQASCQSLS